MNYRVIFSFICKILRIEAVFMMPAVLVSLLYGEYAAAKAFVLTIALLLAISFASRLLPTEKRGDRWPCLGGAFDFWRAALLYQPGDSEPPQ